MRNRDIYQKDPSIRKLVNEGVANVNDSKNAQIWRSCGMSWRPLCAMANMRRVLSIFWRPI